MTWRRWRPGPKHGLARGVAVFGPSGSNDQQALTALLARCEALRTWASGHEVALTDDPGSLSALDRNLDAWAAVPEIGPTLGNETGLYLGTVIVNHVRGARWHTWPNGHPVIRLGSGRELDVIALVRQRLAGQGRDLPIVYADAASS